MPELPEVETVLRTLEHQLQHPVIQSVRIIYPKIIENMSADEFAQKLVHQRFEEYHRRGKYLIFQLSDYVLVAHLRMEGKFYIVPEETVPDKHTHLILKLEDQELHYNDVRKFGRFYLYAKKEPIACIASLGKEPFDDTLDGAYCRQYCRHSRLPLKSLLLDQHFIAGIGNIYANEICFASGLNPHCCSSLISEEKWGEIIGHTRTILSKAIEAGGTTIRSYTSSLGVTGLFQLSLNVHTMKQCPLCHGEIEKEFIGGRGTYYCPNCQKQKATVIAVSGTIGSGKSQLMRLAEKMHYPCIGCDEVNRTLLEQIDIQNKLAEILDCHLEEINKAYLAERIFTNENDRKKVERFLHQEILKKIRLWIKENQEQAILFVEVPLLFEAGWQRYFDCNILVCADEQTVYKRLRNKRHLSDEEIKRRIACQMSVEEKRQKADFVIENNSTLSALKSKLKKTIDTIILLSADKGTKK